MKEGRGLSTTSLTFGLGINPVPLRLVLVLLVLFYLNKSHLAVPSRILCDLAVCFCSGIINLWC